MATRTTIEVDIDDEDFKRFAEKFKKYQEALAQTPGAWRMAGEEIQQTTVIMDAATNSLIMQTTQVRRLLVEQQKETRELKEQERTWSAISKQAKTVHGSVAGFVESAARGDVRSLLGEVKGVVGSLPLAGGILAAGLGAAALAAGMAHGVGQERLRGFRLGGDPKAAEAFDIAFKRYGLEGLPERVAEAQQVGHPAFPMMRQLVPGFENMDPSEAARRMIPAITQFMQGKPPEVRKMILDRALGGIVSMPELRAMQALNERGEFGEASADYERMRKQGYTPEQLKRGAVMDTRLSEAARMAKVAAFNTLEVIGAAKLSEMIVSGTITASDLIVKSINGTLVSDTAKVVGAAADAAVAPYTKDLPTSPPQPAPKSPGQRRVGRLKPADLSNYLGPQGEAALPAGGVVDQSFYDVARGVAKLDPTSITDLRRGLEAAARARVVIENKTGGDISTNAIQGATP